MKSKKNKKDNVLNKGYKLRLYPNETYNNYFRNRKHFGLPKFKSKKRDKFSYTTSISKANPGSDLFDREIDIEDSESGKFEVLGYNFPNGIYRPQDFIRGDITVKGVEAGSYTLYVKMKHAKANIVLEEVIEFDLVEGQTKKLNFGYEVTVVDRIGFYDFDLTIKGGSENLASYFVPQSIYISQEEWEYFYEIK